MCTYNLLFLLFLKKNKKQKKNLLFLSFFIEEWWEVAKQLRNLCEEANNNI